VNSTTGLPSLTDTTYDASYNHAVDLCANSSLQIVNGAFSTKTAGGYGIYSGTYYGASATNSVNYSTIPTSGYRYATFRWELSDITSGSSKQFQNYMYLTFHGASGISILNGNLQNMEVWYRFFESTKVNNNDVSGGNVYNTIWINGASDNSGSPVSSTNYYTPTNSLVGLVSYNAGVLKLLLPKPTSNKAVTVLVRIGLNMGQSISFQRVSLYADHT
jgi:hypothetical protein